VGVEPVDELAGGRNPDDLRELVEHSATTGSLDRERRDGIVTALELDRAPLREVVRPRSEVAGVPADADAATIRAASRDSGHLRLVVADSDGRPAGVVHVRDALAVPAATTARELMRPIRTLPADLPIHDALSAMQAERTQIALVGSGDSVLGLVTLHDLLDRLLPTPA
jgi:CBS domain containing-hemolysin-like protein